MADQTTAGHAEAVKAVAGQLAPKPPKQQVQEDGKIVTTRDLKAEQDLDDKLDKEATKALGGTNPFTDSLEGKERKQRAVRTLHSGKTEAVLEDAPPYPTFPPDDGGYNPEKRTHAGPGGTKVPSAVGKNVNPDDSDLRAAGWKDSQIKGK